MAPRLVALLTAIALAGGLSACGADDEFSTDVPRTSPDLTIPTATTELPDADTTPSTSTLGTTPTTAQGVAPPAVAQPPAAVTPPPPPAASTTGGAGAGTGGGTDGQSTTGGAAPADPDFQNFCRDNPGAGPPC